MGYSNPWSIQPGKITTPGFSIATLKPAGKPAPAGSTITGFQLAKVPTTTGKAAAGGLTRLQMMPVYSKPAPAAPAPKPAPAPAPAPRPTVTAQNPQPLVSGPEYDPMADVMKMFEELQNQINNQPKPTMPEFKIASGSDIAGNATGFTRAQSSARKAGLTNKGTSRLRINRMGQTSRSSGLNIGV